MRLQTQVTYSIKLLLRTVLLSTLVICSSLLHSQLAKAITPISKKPMNIFSFQTCRLFVENSELRLVADFNSEPNNKEIDSLTQLLRSWANTDSKTAIYVAAGVDGEKRTLSLTSDPGSWKRQEGARNELTEGEDGVYELTHPGVSEEKIKDALDDFAKKLQPPAKLILKTTADSNTSNFSLVLP